VNRVRIDLRKLGLGIRFLRQGKGWSLGQLAAASGVSKAYCSDLENGSAGKPNVEYLLNVALALGQSLDLLVAPALPSGEDLGGDPPGPGPLPPGLVELAAKLKGGPDELSGEELKELARIHWRGHRPRSKQDWWFVLDAIRRASQSRP
jgi:transcriptional regulator with XRE-family HTH domain